MGTYMWFCCGFTIIWVAYICHLIVLVCCFFFFLFLFISFFIFLQQNVVIWCCCLFLNCIEIGILVYRNCRLSSISLAWWDYTFTNRWWGKFLSKAKLRAYEKEINFWVINYQRMNFNAQTIFKTEKWRDQVITIVSEWRLLLGI